MIHGDGHVSSRMYKPTERGAQAGWMVSDSGLDRRRGVAKDSRGTLQSSGISTHEYVFQTGTLSNRKQLRGLVGSNGPWEHRRDQGSHRLSLLPSTEWQKRLLGGHLRCRRASYSGAAVRISKIQTTPSLASSLRGLRHLGFSFTQGEPPSVTTEGRADHVRALARWGPRAPALFPHRRPGDNPQAEQSRGCRSQAQRSPAGHRH